MAASRTGTTKWKALRLKVLRQAQRQGLDSCPECGIRLDYSGGPRHRASAEVDHVTPYSKGGTDTPENCRVVCNRCNKSMGNKGPRKRPKRQLTSVTLQTSREW